MNDNEHILSPFWAQQFCGHTDDSLLAALGILAGLLEKPHAFENCAAAIRKRMFEGAIYSGSRPSPLGRKTAILTEVATKHGVTISEMMGQSKVHHISSARHEACYRLREEMGLTFPRIGVIMGNRDHTTAMNSWRRHNGKLTGEPYTRGQGIYNVSEA